MLEDAIEDAIADKGIVISQDFERAQEPGDLLVLLKQFGLLDEDIAQATDTHVRTVRRWKAAGPGTVAAERLGQLRNLILLLRRTEGLSDLGISYWLRHANSLLEDYTPLEVLGAAGFRSVREAALCFVDTQRSFHEPILPRVLDELHARQLPTDRQASSGTNKQKRRSQLTAVS